MASTAMRCRLRRLSRLTPASEGVLYSSSRPSSMPRLFLRLSGPVGLSTRGYSSDSIKRYVGAHISASGGCLKALENAQQWLGPHARAFAFFIRPRLSWKPVPPIDNDTARLFRDRLRLETEFDPANVVVHGSYIVNFGSHDAELRRRSVELMVEEVAKCAQLGVASYVFHPGSCTRVPDHLQWPELPKKPRKKGSVVSHAERAEARHLSAQYIGECMAEVLRRTEDVTLCVENMCGQGNVLGRDFHELRAILDHAVAHRSAGDVKDRLGVCLDTCHAHSSGMSMQTADECDRMVQSFDEIMGDEWLKRGVLKVLHVNDSMDACGSKRDRHENIGLGRIGLNAFDWLMNNPRFCHLPMILETPRRGHESLSERVCEVDDGGHRELLQKTLVEDSDANEIDLLLKLVRD